MIVTATPTPLDKSDEESIASVHIIDLPDSTLGRKYSVSSSLPPPYMKPRNTNLRIARLVAVTVVLVSFIIGGAIVLAAYLQASHARHSLEKQVHSALATHVEKVATPAPLTATTTESADESGESSDSSEDTEKGIRRLDTEADILEEFLENEGKILRLPTSDGDININDIVEMFLGRNNVDDTDCFVEKQPVNGGSEAVVKIPIKSNSTSAPVLARVSGERVSIVCRTSTFGAGPMPFDLPPPMIVHHNPVVSVMPPWAMNGMMAPNVVPMQMDQMIPLRSIPILHGNNPMTRHLMPPSAAAMEQISRWSDLEPLMPPSMGQFSRWNDLERLMPSAPLRRFHQADVADHRSRVSEHLFNALQRPQSRPVSSQITDQPVRVTLNNLPLPNGFPVSTPFGVRQHPMEVVQQQQRFNVPESRHVSEHRPLFVPLNRPDLLGDLPIFNAAKRPASPPAISRVLEQPNIRPFANQPFPSSIHLNERPPIVPKMFNIPPAPVRRPETRFEQAVEPIVPIGERPSIITVNRVPSPPPPSLFNQFERPVIASQAAGNVEQAPRTRQGITRQNMSFLNPPRPVMIAPKPDVVMKQDAPQIVPTARAFPIQATPVSVHSVANQDQAKRPVAVDLPFLSIKDLLEPLAVTHVANETKAEHRVDGMSFFERLMASFRPPRMSHGLVAPKILEPANLHRSMNETNSKIQLRLPIVPAMIGDSQETSSEEIVNHAARKEGRTGRFFQGIQPR